MISIILIALAAVFNAVMDTVENGPAFNRSIFRNKNPKWWSKEVSWKYVKPLPLTKYKPDAWHLAKSAMIVLMCLACILYRPLLGWWDIFIMGAVWNLTFVTFYHKIFR